MLEDIDLEVERQATELESVLPRLMRRIFTLPINHPTGDLPVAQLRACSFLLFAGATSITDLADELGVSVSAATQIADRLEKIGYVGREADAADRRVKLVSLTPLGLDIMAERRRRRVERLTEVLATVSAEKREAVLEAIQELLAASELIPVAQPGAPPASLPADLRYASTTLNKQS